MWRESMPRMPEQCFETLGEPGIPRHRPGVYANNHVLQFVKLGRDATTQCGYRKSRLHNNSGAAGVDWYF
jgi:hypothetical protein